MVFLVYKLWFDDVLDTEKDYPSFPFYIYLHPLLGADEFSG